MAAGMAAGGAAVTAGLLGAVAAAAAKLALGPGGAAAPGWAARLRGNHAGSPAVAGSAGFAGRAVRRLLREPGPAAGTVSGRTKLAVLLRGGGVGLALACNAVMWTVFARALRLCSSSATASLTTTASNFISSAILGRLLFGETWTPLWWVGLVTMLCGLVLLHTAAPRPGPLPEEKKEA